MSRQSIPKLPGGHSCQSAIKYFKMLFCYNGILFLSDISILCITFTRSVNNSIISTARQRIDQTDGQSFRHTKLRRKTYSMLCKELGSSYIIQFGTSILHFVSCWPMFSSSGVNIINVALNPTQHLYNINTQK